MSNNMKVKKNKTTSKIKKDQIKIECPQYFSFSFRHLTKNKDYNFEKLDKGQKRDWSCSLTERLMDLSKETWVRLANLSKENGFETFSNSQIRFSPSDYNFTPDEKVIVFRFNSENGRIIGIKPSSCSVFYIIGFDTNFSAYGH